MGIRTSSPLQTPYRDLGRTLLVVFSVGFCACKSGPTTTHGPPSSKATPAQPPPTSKAPPAPARPPARKPAASAPKPSAKKAPRAADASSRAASIGDLRFVERVFNPEKPQDSSQLPVLVMIHGLGDKPGNFLHLADTLTTPHRALSLQGLRPYNGSFGQGFAWFNTRVKAGKDKKLASEIDAAAKAVAQGLLALNEQEGQPKRRFVVTGFSQGGILSYALAVQYPELVATALPISGLLPAPARRPKGKARTKIVAFHGEADKIVPFGRGRELGNWLQAQGFDYALRSFSQVGHRIPPKMARPLLETLDAVLAKSTAKQ